MAQKGKPQFNQGPTEEGLGSPILRRDVFPGLKTVKRRLSFVEYSPRRRIKPQADKKSKTKVTKEFLKGSLPRVQLQRRISGKNGKLKNWKPKTSKP